MEAAREKFGLDSFFSKYFIGEDYDYLEKYKQFDGNMENPVLLEAQQKAERAGMNMSIGNGTGILGDGTKDKGVVDIVINDISRYGIEVDGNGSTYKATSNLNIGENSYNN